MVEIVEVADIADEHYSGRKCLSLPANSRYLLERVEDVVDMDVCSEEEYEHNEDPNVACSGDSDLGERDRDRRAYEVVALINYENGIRSEGESSVPVFNGISGLKAALGVYSPIDIVSNDSYNILSMPHFALDELLSLHGIADNCSDDVSKRRCFIQHCLSGNCFKVSAIHCSNIQKNFIGKNTFIRAFLDSLLVSGNSEIMKMVVLAAEDLKLLSECHSRDSIIAISHIRDFYQSTFDSCNLVCELDRLTFPQVKEQCYQHGLDIDHCTLEVMRNRLLRHIFSTSCILKFNQSCVSHETDSLKRIHISILQEAIKRKVRKRPLMKMMDTIGLSYVKENSVTFMRRQILKLIAKIQKGKKVEYERDRKYKYRQGLLADEIQIPPQSFTNWPEVMSDDIKESCIDDFYKDTSLSTLRHLVCAVCGERKPGNEFEVERFKISHPAFEVLKKSYPDNAKNPFENDPVLNSYMLHPDGICRPMAQSSDFEPSLVCCSYCSNFIFKRGEAPPFSIVNDLFLGDIPAELADLNFIEEAMIARRRAKCCVVHLQEYDENSFSARGPRMSQGQHLATTQRGIKGHFIVFPSHPEQLLNVLPRTISDMRTYVCVVFVGSQPPTQEWLLEHAKPLVVRKQKVIDALQWLVENNPLYADVEIDVDFLRQFDDEFVLPVHIDVQENHDISSYISPTHDNNNPTGNPEQDGSAVQTLNVYDSVVVTDLEGKDVSSREMTAAALNHLRHGGKFIQMRHEATPSNDYTDYNLYPLLYPTLFPYGLGGFNVPSRASKISMRAQARHFFLLADERFQKHYSFLFSVFNTLQRHDLSSNASVKIDKNSFDKFVNELNNIPMSAIDSVLEKCTTSKTNGYVPHNDDENRVKKLSNKISLISSSVEGSMAGKNSMRNEIRSMIMSLGLPSFFITVNPADCYNPVVKIMSGCDIDIDKLLPADVPTFWSQASLIAKNPFTGAKFFNHFIETFVNKILGRTRPGQMGVLGKYKAHYGTVEAQGRGSLHCHLLLWLDGSLNPQEIRDKIIAEEDEEFVKRLLTYLDDSMHTHIPEKPPESASVFVLSEKFNPSAVRRPDKLDRLYDLKAAKDFALLVENSQEHKHTSSCYKYSRTECRFGLDEKHHVPETTVDVNTGELNYKITNGMIGSYCPSIIKAVRCNMDIKFIGSGASAKAILYYITDYITKTPLKAHVAFAALRAAKEKMQNVFESTVDVTKLGRSMLVKCANAIIAKQELSAQQVAAYLLGNGDHYTNRRFRTLFWPSFEGYVANNGGCLEEHDHQINSRTSEDNIDTPDRDVTTFQDGTDNDPEPDVEDGNDDNTYVPYDNENYITLANDLSGNIISKANPVLDYIHRGDEIFAYSLWDFTARFDKVSESNSNFSTTDNDDGDIAETQFIITSEDIVALSDTSLRRRGRKPNVRGSLKPPHPQCDTHLCRLRDYVNWFIPVPTGPKIYRRDRPEIYEAYCRLMLILFKPWTTVSDLKPPGTSWISSFESFQQTCEQRVLTIIKNIQILHECRDSRDDHFAQRRIRLRGLSSTALSIDPHENSNLENFDENDELAIVQSIEHAELARSKVLLAEQIEANAALKAMFSSKIYRKPTNNGSTLNLEECIQDESHLIDNNDNLENEWRKFYDSQKNNWMKQAVTVCSNSNSNDESSSSITIDISSTDIARKESNRTYDTVNELDTPEDMRIHPVVLQRDIISEFTLNREQEDAFTYITNHSLNNSTVDRLKMYLAGRGGTGKSRVIDALRMWFEKRSETSRFRLCAFTGAAAKNVEGMTLHSALRFNTKRKKISMKSRAELDSIWAGVDYLFIDEISMVSCEFLSDVSDALSFAKNDTREFGGINVIFAGDFCQLSPVGGTPLYGRMLHLSKKPRSSLNEKSLKRLSGRLLWLQFTTIVTFHRQMRQIGPDNERLRVLLARISLGKCNDDDYDLLCSRLLQNVGDQTQDDWLTAPIITRQNAIKDALNRAGVITFAQRHNVKYHNYYAVDSRNSQKINSDSLEAHLHTLHSGKTQQLMGVLPLAVGIPVIFTHNYDISSGIVNGTEGILRKIRYTLDDKGRRIAKSCVVHVSNSSSSLLPTLHDKEVVALQESSTFSIRNPITRASLTVTRHQVPITPAFAMTDYKAQGKTMKKAIIDIESCRSLQSLYVMLSRVKTLDGLLILRPFKKERLYPKRSKDTKDLLIEIKRIRYHSASTMLKFEENELTNTYIHERLLLRQYLKGIEFES